MQKGSKSPTKIKKKSLFDTSAVIALLKKEPGYKILDEIIKDIIPDIIPFCEDVSIKTGELINITKDYGLSLGDRACIATRCHYDMKIYTTN